MKTAEETLDFINFLAISYDQFGYGLPVHEENYQNKMISFIKRYAEEMVKHNLKIAAENVDFETENFIDENNLWDLRHTNIINMNSITNIKIELL